MQADLQVMGRTPSIPGLAAVTRRALYALATRLRDELKTKADQAFAVSGHQLHGGASWAPLKATTEEIRQRFGFPPGPPMVRSGKMAASNRVMVALAPLPGGAIQWRIHMTNEVSYAEPHMTGFRNVWTGTMVVARPPIQITPEDLKEVVASIMGYFGPNGEGVTRAGSKGGPRTPVDKKGWRKLGFLERMFIAIKRKTGW